MIEIYSDIPIPYETSSYIYEMVISERQPFLFIYKKDGKYIAQCRANNSNSLKEQKGIIEKVYKDLENVVDDKGVFYIRSFNDE
jgi:hypothetical protein